MRNLIIILFSLLFSDGYSQNKMTPEFLWKLGRVSGVGISKDGTNIVYSVTTPDVTENKSSHQTYMVPLKGGNPVMISNADSVLKNKNISPDGKYIIYNKEVQVKNMKGSDIYPGLPKSNAYVFDNLNFRHWDTWEDGKFDHVFVAEFINGKPANEKDLMPGEPFDCPQKPFGGDEDYVWSPDSKYVVYVTKKKFGKDYAISTNTDLYQYEVSTGKTTDLTEEMKGYDINPSYSKKGELAWLSMKREGYESDKQDIVVKFPNVILNLTKERDDLHVEGFRWSNDGRDIYFWAPVKGTEQLFVIHCASGCAGIPDIRQITKGDYQFSDIIGEDRKNIIASVVDINHATELYSINVESGDMKKLTHVNDAMYSTIGVSKAEIRNVTTTDGKLMPTWVIYPPGFDATKKYPTLLFCLGGPQGTTPLYSFRWNFQLMAAQGYIVVAPDRRGVFGDGTKWTEEISKDWGGQVIKDYLSATDDISKEKFVDKSRIGCVGASYGGYSVLMLEALHNGRFKTFIDHDGVFDFKSEFGTTDEMWFEYWEKGGAYWEKNNKVAQRSFSQNPIDFVDKWNTPILIIQGGRDYRVPVEQGLAAFKAAQLRGIKSKLLYLPDENHWVLSAQNAMVWQHEFFKWLDETMK